MELRSAFPLPVNQHGELARAPFAPLTVSCAPPTSYFKRFRMEVDLHDDLPRPPLPCGYRFVPWDPMLLETHADTLSRCFHDEIDGVVFPSLSNPTGCFYLMSEICRKAAFEPQATWLLCGPDGYCGTVQGVRERGAYGAIQNLGITAAHRGKGLGSALLMQALRGFWNSGLGRAYLEVTAQNDGAVRLYRRLGFRRKKTLYKALDPNVSLSSAT